MTTVGVLGGGQLGRMLALAGYPLGLRFRFLDPAPEAPAEQLAQRLIHDFRDARGLDDFLSGLAVVTYEFENVPVELARRLEQKAPVHPPPHVSLIRHFHLPSGHVATDPHDAVPALAPAILDQSRTPLPRDLVRRYVHRVVCR